MGVLSMQTGVILNKQFSQSAGQCQGYFCTSSKTLAHLSNICPWFFFFNVTEIIYILSYFIYFYFFFYWIFTFRIKSFFFFFLSNHFPWHFLLKKLFFFLPILSLICLQRYIPFLIIYLVQINNYNKYKDKETIKR